MTRTRAREWKLQFFTYSGMRIPIDEGPYRQMLAKAGKKNARARARNQPVDVLTPGRKWEHETSDDAALISDCDGILRLDPILEEDE
jgi:hypothetical protein